jgi:hypothetical protein
MPAALAAGWETAARVGIFLHPTLGIDAENGHCLGLIGAQISMCAARRPPNGKMPFATMSERPVVHRFRLTLKAKFGKRKARTADSNCASAK